MSGHEFVFTVHCDNEALFETMLVDLAAGVLGRVGYGDEGVVEIVESVRSAVARGAASGGRECRVRFQAAGGELEVEVCYAGAGQWRLARRLP